MESFGERLRETRRTAGLSQNELALRSGVPKTRLSRYENGHILPSLHTLAKLSTALDTPPSILLGQTGAGVELLSQALRELGVEINSREEADAIARIARDVLQEGSGEGTG